MTNLENIEKKFIIEGDAEIENIEKSIERVSKFSNVDITGYVRLDNNVKKISIKDKILLIIATRYLANKLQEKLKKEPTISIEVDSNEISKMLGTKVNVISARLKDLKDERKILSKKAGVFTMATYSIESLLSKLENKEV